MIKTLARPSQPDSALYLVESCRTDIRANQMMDELFQDIEAYLQAPNTKLKHLAPASPLALPTAVPTQFPAAESLSFNTWDKIKTLSSERYLIGLGVASFVIAGGLLLGGIFRKPAAPAPEVSLNPGDVEFARYASQALGYIRSTSRQTPTPAANSALTHANTPGLAPTTIVSQDAQGNRVERVYVPVSPNAATATQATNPSNPAPAVAPNPSSPQPLTPVPPPPNHLTKVTQPTVAAKAPVPTIAANLPTPVKPQNNLVGVVELGDRAIALIAHNGLVQRVSPGEIIDNSDWRLTGVQKQSVVLQRGSEVRTVQVGEAF